MAATEKQRDPAYLWYPRDFDMDEEVRLMTYEEEGIYRRLLDHQWFHGGIPADVKQIARLVPKVSLGRFQKCWPSMAAKFSAQDGRLVNLKLEHVRGERGDYREAKRRAGQASAAARKQRNGSAQPNTPPNSARTDVRTEAPTAPEPAFASASAVPSKNEGTPSPPQDRRTQPDRREPNARSKWPVFRGQRLVVFDWQLEDAMGLLGPHLEQFELDAFWQDLDDRCVGEGLIPPARDNGEWLKAELLAEAQRRGLNLRIATAESVTTAPARVRGCRHVPPCADDVTHTRLASEDRKRVPA